VDLKEIQAHKVNKDHKVRKALEAVEAGMVNKGHKVSKGHKAQKVLEAGEDVQVNKAHRVSADLRVIRVHKGQLV
jgi:hypothetical protein